MTQVEMLGYVDFPPIENQAYRLTVAPYSFLWLELQRRAERAEPTAVAVAEQTPLNVAAGLGGIFEGAGLQRLETVNLPQYLPKQRWVAGKSRRIKSTRIVDSVFLNGSQSSLAMVE